MKFVVLIAVALAVVVAALFLFLGTGRPRYSGGIPAVMVAMGSIDIAAEAFRGDYGALPSDDNQAICRALLGNNPKATVFLKRSERSVSQLDELIDQWGVPYRVEIPSAETLIIKSAGPDRTFSIADDFIYPNN